MLAVDGWAFRMGGGRSFSGLDAIRGESRKGSSEDECDPSKECSRWIVGVPGSSGAGVTLDCLREAKTLCSADPSLHAGDVGMLKPLSERPNGLEGRSEELLIWLDLRTNGLVFSGDRL